MSNAQNHESFMSLQRTAARLGVPIAYLRREAESNRVPHLRVGRRLLFSPEAVEQALIERAQEGAKSMTEPAPESGGAESPLRNDLPGAGGGDA